MRAGILAAALVVACLYVPEGVGSQHAEHRSTEDDGSRVNRPSIIQEILSAGNAIRDVSNKGLHYYLNHYGPLAKIVVLDFMDTFGLGRSLQLAIPIIAKMMVIILFAIMQFQPSLAAFQQTARSAYIFLRNFNEPEVEVMNDLTDRVFRALDGGDIQ